MNNPNLTYSLLRRMGELGNKSDLPRVDNGLFRAEMQGNTLLPQTEAGINIFVMAEALLRDDFDPENFARLSLSDEQISAFADGVRKIHAGHNLNIYLSPDRIKIFWQNIILAVLNISLQFKHFLENELSSNLYRAEADELEHMAELKEFFSDPKHRDQASLLKQLISGFRQALLTSEAKRLSDDYKRKIIQDKQAGYPFMAWREYGPQFKNLIKRELAALGLNSNKELIDFLWERTSV